MNFMIATKKGFVSKDDEGAAEHVKTFTHDVRNAMAWTDVQTAQEYADRKYATYSPVVLGDMTQQTYTFYWLGGSFETLTGTGPNDALSKRGYGAGATGALDFYEEGNPSGEYEWSPEKKTWVRKGFVAPN
jgi:hypothetical protein